MIAKNSSISGSFLEGLPFVSLWPREQMEETFSLLSFFVSSFGVKSSIYFSTNLADTRFSNIFNTLTSFFKGPNLKITRSPHFISREGLTRFPLTETQFLLHASVDKERVLYARIDHNQRSTLTLSKDTNFNYLIGERRISIAIACPFFRII